MRASDFLELAPAVKPGAGLSKRHELEVGAVGGGVAGIRVAVPCSIATAFHRTE